MQSRDAFQDLGCVIIFSWDINRELGPRESKDLQLENAALFYAWVCIADENQTTRIDMLCDYVEFDIL